jgi:sulfur relay (sulfurtransferase) DsrF/TusC family protein
LVVVRRSPLAAEEAAEGLRIAIGLTLGVSEVSVLLLDDAVGILAASASAAPNDALRHWQTLGELGVRRFVERESLAERGLAPPTPTLAVEVVERGDVAQLLAKAESVAVF